MTRKMRTRNKVSMCVTRLGSGCLLLKNQHLRETNFGRKKDAFNQKASSLGEIVDSVSRKTSFKNFTHP